MSECEFARCEWRLRGQKAEARVAELEAALGDCAADNHELLGDNERLREEVEEKIQAIVDRDEVIIPSIRADRDRLRKLVDEWLSVTEQGGVIGQCLIEQSYNALEQSNG